MIITELILFYRTSASDIGSAAQVMCVCVCVCLCVCVCVYVRVCIYTQYIAPDVSSVAQVIHTHTHALTHSRTHTHSLSHTHIHIHVCIFVSAHLSFYLSILFPKANRYSLTVKSFFSIHLFIQRRLHSKDGDKTWNAKNLGGALARSDWKQLGY